ncbi:hypothetical protein M0805_008613 [Coniferiporia weirii]|nr:hypothetical protein M0805_008613 [Coniferiporia weirii]
MLVLVLDVVILACGIYYLRTWLRSTWRRYMAGRLPYPPGPNGLPLVGNIFDMPGGCEWEQARQLGKQYGDLIFVKKFGKPYLFVNSYDAAVEFFEKRGHNYSSRPHNTLIELEGWDWMPSLMQYGEDHRKTRQFLFRSFAQSAVPEYCEIQTQAVHQMLSGLLKEPDTFLDLIRLYTGAAILMVAYGYRVMGKDDPYIELAEKGLRSISEAERFQVVNFLPWLRHLPRWIPGTGFHEIIREGRQLAQEMVYKPHELAKREILHGTATPSMTSKLIEANMTEDGKIADESLIAKSTGVAYAGGADTTVSTLSTFVLAMVLYPEVQHHAQKELEEVIGKDNIPTIEDRPNLPYVNAICIEALRWQAVAPLGVAHSVTEDDVFNGYFIPAGTTMLPNIWAMQRDPKEYPEPDKFIPERWLPAGGKELPLDPRKTTFGFGRRICPGRHFAENTIFVTVASILAAFNIEKALDESGIPITPNAEYMESFIRHPKPFKCEITPRSEAISAAILQAVESAD